MDAIRRTLGTIIVLTALLAGCVSPVAAPTPTFTHTLIPAAPAAAAYWPSEEWRSTAPEAQGMDSEKLAEMVAHIQAEQLDLHSLLVVRNGYLVSEIYGHPYTSSQTHWIASVTKPVVSALVGIAIQRGEIKDVRQPLFSLLPEQGVKNLDANKRAIRLEDLLTLTSGLDCNDNPASGMAVMETSANWVGFMLDLPVVAAPGTRFNYCSGVVHVLSAALQKATGMSTREYANQFLFAPIGIAPVPEARWPADQQGVTMGGYGLSLTPLEMARFGYLFLNQGWWNGKQVVPSEWVTASTTWHTDRGDGLGYGYLWTVDPKQKDFAALGRGGEHIFILPDQNLVVVFTAGLTYRDNADFTPLVELLSGYILPAVKSDRALPANPDASARFHAGVLALAQPRQDPPPLPAVAVQISGRDFLLETNPLGWNTLALTFAAGKGEATATINGDQQLAIGLDHLYRVRDTGDALFPEGLRGRWQNSSSFVVDDVWIGQMTAYTFTLHFTGNTTIQITRVEKYTGEEISIQGVISGK